MNYMGVNLVAVGVATVASFAFGAVWYTVLSKQWLAALGKTREQLQGDYTPMIWSVVVELVMAFFLALFTFSIKSDVTIFNALLVAAHLWIGFVITVLIMNHRFEGMSWSLTIIDGLHVLGILAIQAVVLGLFG